MERKKPWKEVLKFMKSFKTIMNLEIATNFDAVKLRGTQSIYRLTRSHSSKC